jgi:dTDP-4-dehydrorhamnose 3,5-epimerase
VDVGLDGVRLIDLTPHRDDRGALTELFRRSWFPDLPGFAQGNLSVSRAGVLRGLHFHRRQADLWVVLGGVAFVGLRDLRRGSPTEGRSASLWMNQPIEGESALYIPPGVAHGFVAVEVMTLLYLVDAEFTGEDEFGVTWDDPALSIDWPIREPILSDRDRSNPALEAVLEDAPVFGRGHPPA